MKSTCLNQGRAKLRFNRRGFTLIELSLVLVIIGLLVGGVLVGKALIKNGEIRKHISMIETYRVAIQTFKLKYNALPGDSTNASGFFTGALNGNGNSLIEGCCEGAGPYYSVLRNYQAGSEWLAVNDHLARAKLIPLASFDPTQYASAVGGKGFLKLKAGAGLFWFGYNGANILRIGGENSNVSAPSWPVHLISTYNALTASDLYALDSKMDDGLPRSGILQNRCYIADLTYASCGGHVQTINGQIVYATGTAPSASATLEMSQFP